MSLSFSLNRNFVLELILKTFRIPIFLKLIWLFLPLVFLQLSSSSWKVCRWYPFCWLLQSYDSLRHSFLILKHLVHIIKQFCNFGDSFQVFPCSVCFFLALVHLAKITTLIVLKFITNSFELINLTLFRFRFANFCVLFEVCIFRTELKNQNWAIMGLFLCSFSNCNYASISLWIAYRAKWNYVKFY